MGKSASAAQTISVPKGGGALQGLGEKFSPDLHTGTGNLTIPIALPAGRNGFQPQLSLAYSSGNGNGPFGVGWKLSVPGVTRKTARGVPTYEDDSDVFILSGSEDLVPVESKPGRTRYRPRTEGLFARIEHCVEEGPGGNDYWQVRSKDGLVSVYGKPAPTDSEPACIADPAHRNYIFAWRLTSTTDLFGNKIVYEYDRDSAQEGPHNWDQLYLRRIRYVDYGEGPDPKFLISVSFVYDDQRPDPFSEYRSGFEIRTRRRCSRIEIRTHPDDADLLASTHELRYADQVWAEDAPPNQLSLLSQVQIFGRDGEAMEPMPPLRFDYTKFTPDKKNFAAITGQDLPAVSLAHNDYELVDLFGSGLPDILEMNGTVRYWRNLGSGSYDLPRPMHAAPAGLKLADSGVQLLDANGDGRADLLVTTDKVSGYYPLDGNGGWDNRSFRRYAQAPTFNLEDPEVHLLDLDGDGVTDALRSGTRFECFFNDPSQGWVKTREVLRAGLDDFPNVNFSDPRVKWADMTGDGLQDIVLVYNGSVCYWPNLGHGNWGKRVTMHGSPRFPYGYDPKRILVGDVDGDGVADLIYVDDRNVTLWMNRSGNGWSDAFQIGGTPPVANFTSVRLADLLGNGVSGLLWSWDLGSAARKSMWFLDFTGGTKPYLLNEVDNQLGAVTKIEYSPSTRFYLEDQRKPETRWLTSLPFPVQVVARVEAIDVFSGGKLTTEYSYHHGCWDGGEREFRGFGRVDQQDSETFAIYNEVGLHGSATPFRPVDDVAQFSPPTLTKTWFHQGPVGDEFGEWHECDFTKEYWQGNPAVFSWAAQDLQTLHAFQRRAQRDAIRALRGSILRTELYGLDGTARQSSPYTTSESLYNVQQVVEENGHPHLVREAGEISSSAADDTTPRIFFPFAVSQRTSQLERGEEPLHRYTFSAGYDDYGFQQSQVHVAVPRQPVNDSAPEPYLATLARTDYLHRDDDTHFLIGRPVRAASYEVLNDGTGDVFALRDRALQDPGVRKVMGHSVNFYDGDAFLGLPFGELGEHGALVRSESLILTPEVLQDAYRSGDSVLSPPEEPCYLNPAGANWTQEYPKRFQESLPALAGYLWREQGSAGPYITGYYSVSEQHRFDWQTPGNTSRGLLLASRDPLGRETSITYDTYALLPTAVLDPAGLTTTATYDYRLLKTDLIVDANGNQSAFRFTPIGLVASAAVMGKQGEAAGDTRDVPGSKFVYDLMAFTERSEPVSVQTIRRVNYVNDTDVPLPQRDETVESREYSDGFGRLLQTRAETEDVIFGDDLVFGNGVLSPDQNAATGPSIGHAQQPGELARTLVSGWQVYDNKGRVVARYEPFFATGWSYVAPTAQEFGERVLTYYDPRGQVLRTVQPDGSETRVVYGVPTDLSDPDTYKSTPWEKYTYDPNDNAGRTHPNDALAQTYEHHWNTPASSVIDALGLTTLSVVRNRAAQKATEPLPPIAEYKTRTAYDIRGNIRTVMDELGRIAFRYVYDFANRPLRTENFDAGVRRSVLDAAGSMVEQRDSKGALILSEQDEAGRPAWRWMRDGDGQQITLRERTVFGDEADSGLSPQSALNANLLGRVYRIYDGAGLLASEQCDFRGNIREKVRQVIADAQLLEVFSAAAASGWQLRPFVVEWEPGTGETFDARAGTLLDGEEYRTTLTYDALGRIRTQRYPRDVEGSRKQLQPTYNRAGALERIALDGTVYVERIVYNAKGQRTLLVYGNGAMTRSAFDPRTFRLARVRSERCTAEQPDGYDPNGLPLQDLAYSYDLSGNVLRIEDRTPGCGVLNNPASVQVTDLALAKMLVHGDALIRQYEYDPLYRLLSATGRTCKDAQLPPPWADTPTCGFNSGSHGTPDQDNAPNLTALSREDFEYDPANNLVSQRRQVGSSVSVRTFGMGGFTPQQWKQATSDHINSNDIWLNPPGNKLTHVGDNDDNVTQTHSFDANGSLIQESGARFFDWTWSGSLGAFRTQANNAEPSVSAIYLYDSTGTRILKLVRAQGGALEKTLYCDGGYEHYSTAAITNNVIRVHDGFYPLAIARAGPPSKGDISPPITFILSDHLSSCTAVLGEDAAWINREEYWPFGETSFGAFARKRYRFIGQERDEESGLYYCLARYFSAWLGRWTAVDPSGVVGGSANLYLYAHANPIRYMDPQGRDPDDPDPDLKYAGISHNPSNDGKPGAADTPGPNDRDILFGSVHQVIGNDVQQQNVGYGVGAFVPWAIGPYSTFEATASGAAQSTTDPRQGWTGQGGVGGQARFTFSPSTELGFGGSYGQVFTLSKMPLQGPASVGSAYLSGHFSQAQPHDLESYGGFGFVGQIGRAFGAGPNGEATWSASGVIAYSRVGQFGTGSELDIYGGGSAAGFGQINGVNVRGALAPSLGITVQQPSGTPWTFELNASVPIGTAGNLSDPTARGTPFSLRGGLGVGRQLLSGDYAIAVEGGITAEWADVRVPDQAGAHGWNAVPWLTIDFSTINRQATTFGKGSSF